MREKSFTKNLPTVPEFRVTDEPNFEAEKTKLIALVKRLSEGGPKVLTKNPHPFFGYMTTEEWDTLQWKHLDHHLRQFGV